MEEGLGGAGEERGGWEGHFEEGGGGGVRWGHLAASVGCPHRPVKGETDFSLDPDTPQ